MAGTSLPERLADELVTRLFEGDSPTRFDEALYVGPDAGALLAAVERYCADAAAAPPAGTVVARNPASASEAARGYDDVEAAPGEYLDEEFALEGTYDYVLCVPAEREWSTLSRAQRSAIANNFGQVTVEDDAIEAAELFVTRGIRDLGLDGRAAFLTRPSVFDSNATATLWERHYYRIEELSRLDPPAGTELDGRRVAVVVTNDADDWETATSRYEAKTHEEALDTSISSLDAPFTAGALMTDDVESFAPDDAVPDAYIELMLADFDAAPVVESTASGAAPVGYVSREQLRTVRGARLREQVRPFTPDVSVDPTAGIGRVVEKLGESRFVFVRAGETLAGIVTRFDLNGLPVYGHLYDCFSQFEIGLRELVRTRVPDWEARTDEFVPYRGQRTVVHDRLMCAELGTLLELVSEFDLGEALPTHPEVDLDGIRRLRNDVAHYVPIVHTMGEERTVDSTERGARQLALEYAYLRDCIDTLEEAG